MRQGAARVSPVAAAQARVGEARSKSGDMKQKGDTEYSFNDRVT